MNILITKINRLKENIPIIRKRCMKYKKKCNCEHLMKRFDEEQAKFPSYNSVFREISLGSLMISMATRTDLSVKTYVHHGLLLANSRRMVTKFDEGIRIL